MAPEIRSTSQRPARIRVLAPGRADEATEIRAGRGRGPSRRRQRSSAASARSRVERRLRSARATGAACAPASASTAAMSIVPSDAWRASAAGGRARVAGSVIDADGRERQAVRGRNVARRRAIPCRPRSRRCSACSARLARGLGAPAHRRRRSMPHDRAGQASLSSCCDQCMVGRHRARCRQTIADATTTCAGLEIAASSPPATPKLMMPRQPAS